MVSDIWQNIYFWSDYGRIMELPHDTAEKEELLNVNRVVIEAGMDLSEEDWIDIAKKAKEHFGVTAVVDIIIRHNLIGGGRVVVRGNVVDNSVVKRYKDYREYG